jgi:hypothetical protein
MPTPAAAAEEVRKIALAAFADAAEILQVIEVLEAGNEDAVVAGVNAAEAGRAAKLFGTPCSCAWLDWAPVHILALAMVISMHNAPLTS